MHTTLKLTRTRQQRRTSAKRSRETEAARPHITTPWTLVRTLGGRALTWFLAYAAVGLLFTILRLITSG